MDNQAPNNYNNGNYNGGDNYNNGNTCGIVSDFTFFQPLFADELKGNYIFGIP